MGAMLAANPDLHTEVLLKRLPGAAKNPLTAHFWLPSVSWIAEYSDGIPEIGDELAKATNTSPVVTESRARAIELYLRMLERDVPVLSKNVALRLASQTALRRQPAVQEALRRLIENEPNSDYARAARNALRSTDPQMWLKDLREAVQNEPLAAPLRDSAGQPNLTPQFLASFRYFSDHVAPELNRPQRMDERSCMQCHGVPGRVPSMELAAPDGNGYWTTAKMLKNYLTLRERVNTSDVETSKLLRKPLNVQTGREDGHQGGRRYAPSERGYQIIRRWALDQPRVTQSLTTQMGAR